MMKMYHYLGLGLALATVGSVVGMPPQAMAEAETTWYNCLTREVFTPEKRAWCDRWYSLQQNEFSVPMATATGETVYVPVPLENGRYQQPDGPLQVLLVNEEGWLTFGDIDGDGKDDAGVIFAVLPDGETPTTYVTTVLDIDGEARTLLPVALGGQILLNGPITIDNTQLTVPLLTETAVINRSFGVENNRLTEVARLPIPEVLATAIPNGTLVFSQTPDYAVRVFTENGTPKINLFDKTTGTTPLLGTSTIIESSPASTIYSHSGIMRPPVAVAVATDGRQTITVDNAMLTDYEQVTGTVTYLPRIALPPHAVVEVTLADVSRADAPMEVIASQTLVLGDRQVPVPFALVYDPGQIDERFTYAVRARILVDGELQFTSTEVIPVITRDNPTEVEIVVDPV
jgi:uncharacterized lipoprotein YbaY